MRPSAAPRRNQQNNAQTSLKEESTMSTTTQTPETKPKGRIRKFLLRSVVVLFVVAIVAHLIFKYSGSGQWETVGVKKNVTVYSMKVPGDNIKKFKAVWKIKSTMSRFAAFVQDETYDLKLGYYDIREFEQKEQSHYSAWKGPFPGPLKTRQYVIKNDFSQDPATKALTFQITAAPDKLPPDDCCYRVKLMDNRWKLTPQGNGEIEVEWTVDMDMGLPYPMANQMQEYGMFWFAPRVQKYLNLARYDNARFDWLEEVPPATQGAELLVGQTSPAGQ
jgi:hypothetical protein